MLPKNMTGSEFKENYQKMLSWEMKQSVQGHRKRTQITGEISMTAIKMSAGLRTN